jgi:hypothetical protein
MSMLLFDGPLRLVVEADFNFRLSSRNWLAYYIAYCPVLMRSTEFEMLVGWINVIITSIKVLRSL